MKELSLGIIGATGAVGREIISILEERNFPLKELRLLASPRSAGRTIEFRGSDLIVEAIGDKSFEGLDIVLGASEDDIARKYADAIRKAGAVFIDNSSAFRLDNSVPLIIPEINPEDIENHQGIISSPNCSTIIALVAVNPLRKLSKIKSMVASTYQAVSGAGLEGIEELKKQNRALIEGSPIEKKVFAHQIAENLIPQIGGEEDLGYTSEEMKLENEGKKILHSPDFRVACTCVRVPVVRSHSISINLYTEEEITVDQAREVLKEGQGLVVYDDLNNGIYPMPLMTSGQDKIYVGRIRKDPTRENGLALWCSGDQVRKGAATNTVQIAELFLDKK